MRPNYANLHGGVYPARIKLYCLLKSQNYSEDAFVEFWQRVTKKCSTQKTKERINDCLTTAHRNKPYVFSLDFRLQCINVKLNKTKSTFGASVRK